MINFDPQTSKFVIRHSAVLICYSLFFKARFSAPDPIPPGFQAYVRNPLLE